MRRPRSERAKAQRRALYAARIHEERAKDRARYAANPERKTAQVRVSEARNPERVRKTKKAWSDKNKETMRRSHRRWAKANPEKARARGRRYYGKHTEQEKARAKAYRKGNPERTRDAMNAYRVANPERCRAIQRAACHRRRVKLLGSCSPGVNPAAWAALVEQFGGCCAYCGKPGTAVDHVVPISKGGRDEIANVLPACKSCNSSKGNRDLSTWLARKGYANPYLRQSHADDCDCIRCRAQPRRSLSSDPVSAAAE
jgi:5-methylcytosine-specific restriction endonuclease McrA